MPTLTYCSLVRSENVRIISCYLNLQTIIDNKRFLHAHRVTTSPLGNESLCEDIIIREMGRTMDWGEFDVDVVTPNDSGREYLAEAIQAQADITRIFLHPQRWGSIN